MNRLKNSLHNFNWMEHSQLNDSYMLESSITYYNCPLNITNLSHFSVFQLIFLTVYNYNSKPTLMIYKNFVAEFEQIGISEDSFISEA